ncbi:MAG: flagellar export protein FliJ [Planctomycetes bacterium]|nr:flagellar export protein FliJ [Planctomycetota bacterium]
MARFKFELAALLRVRAIEEERAKRHFFMALKSLRQKEGELMELTCIREQVKDRCRAASAGVLAIEVEEMLRQRRYINVLYQQMVAKREEVARLRKAFEEVRAVFRQARIKRRAVEKLKDRRRREFLMEETRREARDLDEIGEIYFQNGMRRPGPQPKVETE